jgi:radical SAM protein with 4Fe4S-binding SPASM domain
MGKSDWCPMMPSVGRKDSDGMPDNDLQLRKEVRFLQLETGTACNYKCLYCPVAYFPRKGRFLPLELVDRVIGELEGFPRLEKIYLNGYDEPTLNPQLAPIVGKLAHLPVRITLFTNATNLTSDLAEKIAQTGARIEFDIHLSAVNRSDFEHIHQSKLFDKVISNLRYFAENFRHLHRINVCISMQALDTATDDRIYEELKDYFRQTPLITFRWKPNDRSGILCDTPYAQAQNHNVLRGCSLENRTQDWIHINATGNVILCCQDYFESHVIGNIEESTLTEILASDQRRKYHRWTMGEVEAPKDYICRRCIFAITTDK